MELNLYHEIRRLQSAKATADAQRQLDALAIARNVRTATLRAIEALHQQKERKTKPTRDDNPNPEYLTTYLLLAQLYHRHRQDNTTPPPLLPKSPENQQNYQILREALAASTPSTILVRLADKYQQAPHIFARKILHLLHRQVLPPPPPPTPDSKERIKPVVNEWVQRPSSLLELDAETQQALQATLENVPLSQLVQDIEMCHHYDLEHGRFSERVKRVMGNEHEVLLLDLLRASGVDGLVTEQDIRNSADGVPTPDAVFSTGPVLVFGHHVHWIDSKACFADTQEIVDHWKNQFQKYAQKYGLGMVIYWHGYVVTPLSSSPQQQNGPEGGRKYQTVVFMRPVHNHHVLCLDDQPCLLVVDHFPELRPSKS